MAVFVPINFGAQVEVVFVLGGEPVENRLWFYFDNPPFDLTALQGLADGVYAWHTTNILPFLSADLQLAAVEAKDWTTNPPAIIAVAGPPINGGVAETSHSANVAAFVAFRWPLQLARLRRNGNFVPGVPVSAVDLNTPTASFRSAMFEGYAALIDAARLFTPVLNWRWVVTSQFLARMPRAEQLVGECIGPVRAKKIRLGQRRKRLPIS